MKPEKSDRRDKLRRKRGMYPRSRWEVGAELHQSGKLSKAIRKALTQKR